MCWAKKGTRGMEESIASDARRGFIGIAIAGVAGVAVAINERNPVRAVAVVCFAGFVPGRAIVSNWQYVQERSTTALSVLLSLAVLTLAATVTLWCKLWRPLGLLEVECALSAVVLVAAILRRRRTRSAQNSVVGPSQSSE
jgi:hypothetical protein